MLSFKQFKSKFPFILKSNNRNSFSENKEFPKQKLIKILGFEPEDFSLFHEAFTHRAEQIFDGNQNLINYERLEFLGDAILGSVIANYLFAQAPNKKEGYLTKMRSKIVSRKKLNQIGQTLGLMDFMNPKLQINFNEDIHGDLLESLIGAIYVDQGFKVTESFIKINLIDEYVDLPQLEKTITSHKSLILEWTQKVKRKLEFNTFQEKNAEEIIIFVSIVRLDDKVIAKGRGTSKKKAEESASKRVYYQFQKEIQPKDITH